MSDFLLGTEELFGLLLRAAWGAGVLLVLVWVVDHWGRKWLSPRARYGLWLLVAARLAMLWTPVSSWSLVGQIERGVSFIAPPKSEEVLAVSDTQPLELANHEVAPAMVLDEVDWESAVATAPAETMWSSWTVWTVVAAIWGIGALLVGLKLLLDFWRLRVAVGSMKALHAGSALLLMRRLEQELGLGRPLSLLVCEKLASPAVTGVWRPALLLPRVFLDGLTLGELEHVFRHELTHVKRRDVLVNWILAWLGAVYWFFPLMRFLLSRLRMTRELACDAAVLAKASTAERAAYGKTLVRVLEMAAVGDRPMLTFTVGVAGMVWPMGNSRKESRMMRERLELVMGGRSAGKFAMVSAAALLGLLLVAGFTEGQEKKESNAAGERVAFEFAKLDSVNYRKNQPVEQSYDFAETRKLFEANRMLRFAPWRSAASRSPKAVAEQPVLGVGEVEISAEAALRDWIERVIKESGWTTRKEPTITWHEGDKATISHNMESHERLALALKALHKTPESQFVFEFSFGTMNADDFGKIDVKDFRIAIDSSSDATTEVAVQKSASASLHSEETISRRVPSWRLVLNDAQKKQLLTKLEAIRSFNRLSAPRVTTFNTQIATVTTGVQRPFVTGFSRLENGVDQPRVETVFCGLIFDEQAIALGDGRIWLRLKCGQTEVMGVAEEKQLGTSLTIQSPKIWQMSQTAGLELNLGETLAIFSKSSGREDKKDEVLAMFVTVRAITLPQRPEPQAPKSARSETTSVRTEVFDVSRTHAFRGFPSKLKVDDPLRAKLIAPAFEQLEILIKETIDPESPKSFKRSIENLTLEVTATQEVLEKVQDLIKQLVRLADGEKSAAASADSTEYSTNQFAPLPGSKRAQSAEENLERTRKKDAQNEADLSPEDQVIYKSLDKFVSVKFKEKPLSEILNQFGEICKINIVPDRVGFAEEGIQVNEPVSLELLKSVSLRSALRHILDPLNLDFVVKNEALIITSKRLARGSKTSVAYDVSRQPLLKKIWVERDGKKEVDQETVTVAFDRLQAIIKAKIPAFTEAKDAAEIQPFYTNVTLVVSATREDHEKVADLLKLLEKMATEDAEKLVEQVTKETALRR